MTLSRYRNSNFSFFEIFLKFPKKMTPPVRVDTAYGVFKKTGMACLCFCYR